jgi:hypothetical protein
MLQALADQNGEVAKADFINYVKSSNLFKSFETVDPESDHHWNRKVCFVYLTSLKICDLTIYVLAVYMVRYVVVLSGANP